MNLHQQILTTASSRGSKDQVPLFINVIYVFSSLLSEGLGVYFTR